MLTTTGIDSVLLVLEGSGGGLIVVLILTADRLVDYTLCDRSLNSQKGPSVTDSGNIGRSNEIFVAWSFVFSDAKPQCCWSSCSMGWVRNVTQRQCRHCPVFDRTNPHVPIQTSLSWTSHLPADREGQISIHGYNFITFSKCFTNLIHIFELVYILFS